MVATYGDSCSVGLIVMEYNIQHCNADKIFPVNIMQSNHDTDVNVCDCSRLCVIS
jgi:hypothetical protein